jgi:hypothetical protein
MIKRLAFVFALILMSDTLQFVVIAREKSLTEDGRQNKVCRTLYLCTPHFAAAQSPNFAGSFGGTMVTEAGPSGVQITLTREGDTWKATMKLRAQGDGVVPGIQGLTINGSDISFAAETGRLVLKFSGKLEGDKLSGNVEVFQDGNKVRSGLFTLMRGGEMPSPQQTGGQVADENFNAKVEHPAYTKSGPRVLFDEAHNNFHTASGRYKPFADLITNDGYQIIPGKQSFSPDALKGYSVLLISNALGAPRMADAAAGNSAFTEEESDVVGDWVKAGGSLLLIADHAPMGSANQILAKRFGVDMSKMYTADPQNADTGNASFIVYTRESGRLADHPITRGRNDSERVNKVITFTGQSLKGPAESFAFLKLADTAVDAMPGQNPNPASAAGRAQGLAMEFGKGRVIVMGEAGMLSAQVVGPQRTAFGMNRPGIDNRQLALNIMHWLSRLLK